MIAKTFFSDRSSFLFCLEELKEQVDKYFKSYDFLIFSVYSTYSFTNIGFDVKKIFKTDNFFAFDSSNIFINDKIKEKGVGLTVIKFENKGKIDTFFIDKCQKNINKVVNYFNKNPDKLHIVFSSCDDSCGFINQLSNKLSYSPINNIIGGVIAGTEVGGIYKKRIISNNFFSEEGMAIISFEGVDWDFGISSGFTPYGITYEITKAKNDRVYEVDKESFPAKIKELIKSLKDFDIKYLWYTPIYVLNEKNGHIFSVRTIKEITDEYVSFYANMSEGELFKISFATPYKLLEEDKKVAYKILEKVKYADFVFNFSCLARQYVLEDKQENEIKIYTNIFDTHLFGFFTAGEIAPDDEYCRLVFYNETSIPLVLKEKLWGKI